MTYIAGDKKPSLEDALEHHGIKGMHWGVSRAGRTAQIERVGAGKGSKLDKIKVAAFETSKSAIKAHGSLAGAAANKAANMKAVDARIAKGHATIQDFIQRHGGDRLADSGHVHADRRFTPENMKIKTHPGFSPLTKAVIRDHNTLSDGAFVRKNGTTKKEFSNGFKKHGDAFVTKHGIHHLRKP